MPAIASPSLTAVAVALASVPWVMLPVGIVAPALCRTWLAYLPHGAVSAQSEIVPAVARSARDLMPLGLPGLVMITSRLVAKIWAGAASRLLSDSFSMVASSAKAATS